MTKKPKQLDIIDTLTGEASTVDELAQQLVGRLDAEPWVISQRPLSDFLTLRGPDPQADVDWGPSLTRQEFKDECDINVLMERYEATGVPPPINQGVAQYLDLTAMPADYMSAMALLQEAEIAFMKLPATVRREFDNDPRQFVDFASDPENLSQMQTWGLAPPTPSSEPAPSPAPAPGPAKGLPASDPPGE